MAHLDHNLKQEDLARILGTTELGTMSSSITRLTTLGLTVEYEEGSAAQLHHHLSQSMPCIIFIQTGNLSYWSVDTPHAVVAVGMTEDAVLVNDPAFDDAPISVPADEFLLAWCEFEYRYAVLR